MRSENETFLAIGLNLLVEYLEICFTTNILILFNCRSSKASCHLIKPRGDNSSNRKYFVLRMRKKNLMAILDRGCIKTIYLCSWSGFQPGRLVAIFVFWLCWSNINFYYSLTKRKKKLTPWEIHGTLEIYRF